MNIEEILLFKEKKLVSNVINPKNNARNDGININAKGIIILKLSSKVKAFVIQ